eukprot:SAG22_NODE_3088_length_1952_cov_2.536427_5_plen_51_part_01
MYYIFIIWQYSCTLYGCSIDIPPPRRARRGAARAGDAHARLHAHDAAVISL